MGNNFLKSPEGVCDALPKLLRQALTSYILSESSIERGQFGAEHLPPGATLSLLPPLSFL